MSNVEPEATVQDEADDAPEPVPGGGRLPDWREGPQSLDDLNDEPGDTNNSEDGGDAPDDAGGEPECDDDEGDETEWDDDEDEPASSRWRRRRNPRKWNPRGSGRRAYSRPSYYGDRRSPKQTFFGWWWSFSAPSRWGLYNGAALALGFAFGVPQFATRETAYLADTYHSWTHPGVGIWYVAVAAAWMLSHQSRHWFPPLALAARTPLISMVVGVLLYGATGLPT